MRSLEETSPHPATLVEQRAPHPATVGMARAPHPATVVQRRQPHPATVIQRRQPAAIALVAQRAALPTEHPVTVGKMRTFVVRGAAGDVTRQRATITVSAGARYVPQSRWDFSSNREEVWWTTGMSACRAVGMIGEKGSAFSHLDKSLKTIEILTNMLKAVGDNPIVLVVRGMQASRDLEADIRKTVGEASQLLWTSSDDADCAVMDFERKRIYSTAITPDYSAYPPELQRDELGEGEASGEKDPAYERHSGSRKSYDLVTGLGQAHEMLRFADEYERRFTATASASAT